MINYMERQKQGALRGEEEEETRGYEGERERSRRGGGGGADSEGAEQVKPGHEGSRGKGSSGEKATNGKKRDGKENIIRTTRGDQKERLKAWTAATATPSETTDTGGTTVTLSQRL